MIKLVDARKGLYEKCVELFHNEKIAESIYMYLCDGIEECDAVKPERKKGVWVIYIISMLDGEGCKCSECGSEGAPYWDFCPNCGSYNGGDADEPI